MMELLPTLLMLTVAAGLAVCYLTLRKRGGRFPWTAGREARPIELLDRVALTHQHSLHLVALKGRWLAIAVTPQGCQLLESGKDEPAPIAAIQNRAENATFAGGRP